MNETELRQTQARQALTIFETIGDTLAPCDEIRIGRDASGHWFARYRTATTHGTSVLDCCAQLAQAMVCKVPAVVLPDEYTETLRSARENHV